MLQEGLTPSYRVDPVLIVGETGQGKSFMVQKFCEIMGLEYLYMDASAMVRTGIRGTSVDDIIKNLLRRCDYDLKKAQSAVVVLDEFDKLLVQGEYNNVILNQLLRLIEGSEYMIEKGSMEDAKEFEKINSLNTTHIFFILVGSFQRFKENKEVRSGFLAQDTKESYGDILDRSGLPSELRGRVKEVIELRRLDEEDMMSILRGASSPLKRYEAMLKELDEELRLSEEELCLIAKEAAQHSLGARTLDELLYQKFKPRFLMERGKEENPKELFLKVLEQKLFL